MDLGDCYRLLGLRSGASFTDIKMSYRRLAQQYHPDINPNDTKAKEKFIAVTEAYKFLLEVVPPEESFAKPIVQPPEYQEQQFQPQPPQKRQTTDSVPPKPPHLSEVEHRLKWQTYKQLQGFLKAKRFPQAISLAEALAQRIPKDIEVRQWLAIAYQLWARTLIAQNQLSKARIYLKKAMKTDPHNKSLWLQIQRDLQRLEQMLAAASR